MDTLYIEVGKTMELMQKWEEKLKLVTIKCNIQESDDKRSLSNMCSFLLKNNFINDDEYLILKEVIKLRNILIHRFFIDYSGDAINLLFLLQNTVDKSIEILEKI